MSQPLLTLAAAISEVELTVNSFLFFCELLAAAAAAAPEYPEAAERTAATAAAAAAATDTDAAATDTAAAAAAPTATDTAAAAATPTTTDTAAAAAAPTATDTAAAAARHTAPAAAAAAAAMLARSVSRRSFFRSGYGRVSAAAAAERRLQVFFVSLMFLLPSLYVYSAGSPKLLQLCMQRFRWVEVPPQADPSLLRLRPAAPTGACDRADAAS
ncbi:hypothetical protein, conserved [Eimeria tenella]|uniref:Uncharacterized protein n=1 Tax=Eimeria tenella TaxID=5802 RepID=U6KJK5_EIMTE|nr:hypothetical protein, conserved [Eimeria tenella]CDJ38215.1 hypothetical protein, conserved [Eimeria tenella]|eukprot:XP_013229053.1 hypothetical protein, conserved [Eimeria tenella]